MDYFRNDGMEVMLTEVSSPCLSVVSSHDSCWNVRSTSTDLGTCVTQHDLLFDVPTLVYMPHCPRSLFDDLLRKNWSVEALKRLVILGNRLDMYDDP